MEMQEHAPGDAPQKGCDRAMKGIERAGDRRLGSLRLLVLRRHMKGCPECNSYFTRMIALLGALDSIDRVAAPVGFAESVLASLYAVNNAEARDSHQGKGKRGLLWVGGAAILGIGVAVGVTAGLRFRGSQAGSVIEERLAAGQAVV